MAYSILVDPGLASGNLLKNIATASQRTLATVEFLTNECIIPDVVDPDEVFDIKIVYRLLTIEKRDYNGMLEYFQFIFDGGFYKIYYEAVVPYIAFWAWYLLEWSLFARKGVTNPTYVVEKTHSRSNLGQKMAWNFHGTISQLLGEAVQPGDSVQVGWAISGRNIGYWDPSDFWPYNWNLQEQYHFDGPCAGGAELTKTIQVNLTPTPPYPLFDLDYCAVLQDFVKPDESFGIKVGIENANQYSGAYSIKCYCQGNEITLKIGTIGKYKSKRETFYVTANQLAGIPITQDTYLNFELRVSNIDGPTDWWPAQIAVVIIDPSTASLSGRVTDKMTGYQLAGVSVKMRELSTSTSASGLYSFEDLEPDTYEVEFTKTGYWPVTESKKVLLGPNTLNIAMTSTSEPKPDGEMPWSLIAIGGTAALGLAVVLATRKKEAKK